MLDRVEFAKEVRDALAHLYDTCHLQEHPLGVVLLPVSVPGAVSIAQTLRRVLLEAIESLQPSTQLPYSAPEWRPYRVLFQRYVQRMPVERILEELAISDRQFQREQARALRAIVGLLWGRAQGNESPPVVEAEPAMSGVTAEVHRLAAGARRMPLDAGELVRGAARAVQKLAESHAVTLDLALSPNLPPVYGDPALLRQVILSVLSHLLAQAEGGKLRVALSGSKSAIALAFTLMMEDPGVRREQSADAKGRLALSRELAEVIGGHLTIEGNRVQLDLPRRPMVLLVVDDNQDVIRLLERYLADGHYEVVGARTGEQAITLARELHPFLITLDVMMPTHDGWEVLQNLKHNPATGDIPVAVCSVLNEPELASSLGADDYLKKPITQGELLELLARWEQAVPRHSATQTARRPAR